MRAPWGRGIALFVAASETFSLKNTNCTIAEGLDRLGSVMAEARADHGWIRGYVSTVWACPYEGAVALEAVVRVVRSLVDLGCDEIALGDTIASATPETTERVLEAVLPHVPVERVALHMHDTRGQALACVEAGWRMGIRRFDASAGGLGGCPYAPGARGNVATERVIERLESLGAETGVDLAALRQAGSLIREALAGAS